MSTPTTEKPSTSLAGDAAADGGSPISNGGQASSSSNPGPLDPEQIMNLIKHLPGVFTKLSESPDFKDINFNPEALAQLQNMQAATASQFSSSAGLPAGVPRGSELGPQGDPYPSHDSGEDDLHGDGDGFPESPKQGDSPPQKRTPRSKGARGNSTGNEDWVRQRKDNHKEVERRRRGNINEGINELARIVPNGTGEKSKGAILTRAVQYIHHLKENEARNIEKWTLEKLLMDQAMGDLQAQLDETRRAWDAERRARGESEDADGRLGKRSRTE